MPAIEALQKMVAPILDELAKEYDGQIVIYKVDMICGAAGGIMKLSAAPFLF